MRSTTLLQPFSNFLKAASLILTITATLALGGRTEAATLYGATSAGGPGELYTLDPATGAMIIRVGGYVKSP